MNRNTIFLFYFFFNQECLEKFKKKTNKQTETTQQIYEVYDKLTEPRKTQEKLRKLSPTRDTESLHVCIQEHQHQIYKSFFLSLDHFFTCHLSPVTCHLTSRGLASWRAGRHNIQTSRHMHRRFFGRLETIQKRVLLHPIQNC